MIHFHLWPAGSIPPGFFFFLPFSGGTRNEKEMGSKKSRRVEPLFPLLLFHICHSALVFLFHFIDFSMSERRRGNGESK